MGFSRQEYWSGVPLPSPDMSTNVTHFTKQMTKMIGAMDTPEASIASLWEMLTSSPWWTTILITIILVVLFLLFAPCICNCITGFVSSRMKAFKLQMVAQTPATAVASSDYYLGSCGAREVRSPCAWRGDASWLSSHGRGLGPRDALKKTQVSCIVGIFFTI